MKGLEVFAFTFWADSSNEPSKSLHTCISYSCRPEDDVTLLENTMTRHRVFDCTFGLEMNTFSKGWSRRSLLPHDVVVVVYFGRSPQGFLA